MDRRVVEGSVGKFDMSTLLDFVEKIREKNGEWVSAVAEAHGEVTVTVPRDAVIDIC